MMLQRLVVCAVGVAGLALAGCSAQVEPLPPAGPTAPAPPAPGTGVDGPGTIPVPAIDPSHSAVVTPDAGVPTATTPGDGIGGEVYVSSPAFRGTQRLNAGFWYPSGALHGAWDIGILRGTPVFAARDGLVVGSRDGVTNHPVGSRWAIPNSPSNWVLLCADIPGKGPSVLYYQHLSPDLRVHRGQRVKLGQRVASSGNTGNSTGDHLHLSASRSPWSCATITASRAELLRYDYLRDPGRRLFAPALFWAQPAPKLVALGKSHKIVWLAQRYSTKSWKICKRNPSITRCGPERRLRAGRIVRVA